MLAKDVMTMAVISVGPNTEVGEIARRLTENRISAVPVVDADGGLAGIVSEGDLIRRLEAETEKTHGSWWLSLFTMPQQLAAEYAKSHGRKASDVMTRDVVTVAEDTPLGDIAQTLERHHIKRVPVVRDGRVVGIISRANLLHGLASARPAPAAPADAGDVAIRKAVLDALRDAPWMSVSYTNVTVEKGVVHLWGLAETDDQIRAMEVATREIPGVKEVRNHLRHIEPKMFYGG